MDFVSAVATVGDVSGITKGGAGRDATDREIEGATFADGLGIVAAGVFGGLPNTSFSQTVGLIAMTGVMSRHVVIFAVSLSLGLGLQLEPQAVQYLPETTRVLLTSGLLPAAFIAIVLNLLLPDVLADEAFPLVPDPSARAVA